MENHIGKKYAHLTVISQFRGGKNGDKNFAIARCDCGREKEVWAWALRCGRAKTCGSVDCQYYRNQFKNFKTPYKECIGQKYGWLTIIDVYHKDTTKYFLCRCECGKEKEVLPFQVIGGAVQTCGSQVCINKKIGYKIVNNDFTGQKFGRLTVLSQYRDTPNKITIFVCDCDCGKKQVHKDASNVITGNAKSCGCLLKETKSDIAQQYTPVVQSLIENSNVFTVLRQMGCCSDGRKIGVVYVRVRRKGNKRNEFRFKWVAQLRFQGKLMFYCSCGSYEEAVKRRIELERQVSVPFLMRNKEFLPKDIDMEYWQNRNKDVEFDVEKYEIKQEEAARKISERDRQAKNKKQ